jgi:hypothetical protein
MTTPKFLRDIPVYWKAAITIGTVFAAGALMSGHVGLPARMTAAEAAISTIRSELAGVREQMILSNCLTITERTGADWRNCLEQ